MRDERGSCTQMHRRSKALAAGVEVGDTLLAINGQRCQHWTTDQATRTINDSLPGHDVTLHLLRCGGDCFKGFVRYEMRIGKMTETSLVRHTIGAKNLVKSSQS